MSTKKPPAVPEGYDPDTGEQLQADAPDATLADVAEKPNAVLVPADDDDYGGDMGAGFENQEASDVSIPMWIVLQPTSPEVNVEPVQGQPEPPRPGTWLNRTTLEYKSGREGLVFVPAITQHLMVQWIAREEDGTGGGYVGQLAMDDPISVRVRAEQPLGAYLHPTAKDEKGRPHQLVETYYVYGVALDADGDPWPGVITFSSTHIKSFKDWMYVANAIVLTKRDGSKVRGLPLFAHAWRLHTRLVKRGSLSWYVPEARLAEARAEECRLAPSSMGYQAARQVYEGVHRGELKADTGTARQDRADAAPRGEGDPDKEDAPY